MKVPAFIRVWVRQWRNRKRPRAILPMSEDDGRYWVGRSTVPRLGKKWKDRK